MRQVWWPSDLAISTAVSYVGSMMALERATSTRASLVDAPGAQTHPLCCRVATQLHICELPALMRCCMCAGMELGPIDGINKLNAGELSEHSQAAVRAPTLCVALCLPLVETFAGESTTGGILRVWQQV